MFFTPIERQIRILHAASPSRSLLSSWKPTTKSSAHAALLGWIEENERGILAPSPKDEAEAKLAEILVVSNGAP